MDSVYVKGENYCPQVFLEKYKHVVRKKNEVTFYYWRHRNFSHDFVDSDDSDEKTQLKAIKYINLFLKERRIIR